MDSSTECNKSTTGDGEYNMADGGGIAKLKVDPVAVKVILKEASAEQSTSLDVVGGCNTVAGVEKILKKKKTGAHSSIQVYKEGIEKSSIKSWLYSAEKKCKGATPGTDLIKSTVVENNCIVAVGVEIIETELDSVTREDKVKVGPVTVDNMVPSYRYTKTDKMPQC